MSNLPPITDHDFWREVKKHLLDYTRSLPEIAADLGVDCKELVAWVERYQPPPKPEQRRAILASQLATLVPIRTPGRRFQAWRKAREGAAEALRK